MAAPPACDAGSLAMSLPKLIPYVADGRYGFINATGTVVVPATYDLTVECAEGLCAAKNGDTVYFLDEQGQPKFETREDVSLRASGDRIVFHTGDGGEQRSGFLDTVGSVVIPATFETVDDFSEGLAAVEIPSKSVSDILNARTVLIDASGTPVFETRYAYIHSVSEGLFVAQDGESGSDDWVIATRDGSVIFRWNSERDDMKRVVGFRNQRARFESGHSFKGDRRYGYIDPNGRRVVEARFADAGVFSDGLASACETDEKCGYIDPSGTYVIQPTWHTANAFRGCYALVSPGPFTTAVIDREGNVLFRSDSDPRSEDSFWHANMKTILPGGLVHLLVSDRGATWTELRKPTGEIVFDSKM
jgi:hypothetical protein